MTRKMTKEEGDQLCEDVLELMKRVYAAADEPLPKPEPVLPTPNSLWLDKYYREQKRNYRNSKEGRREAAREAAGRSMYLHDDD